ncbi:hypothetical protein N791_11805 [Lysobacter defluvii IMMIB APB-9 = DSM 18482]|uniref:Uncharacterized protein n=1 Tax=Lysobacter defluvii IMMIB APB-9 = DSM 18482 TaxID=1385515 RepID=A0A0A0MBS8_9GAMM|nr:hypothetical protein N791_11805 [Lysobacter defluvii IMMIB APB-9 = DSM 18482]
MASCSPGPCSQSGAPSVVAVTRSRNKGTGTVSRRVSRRPSRARTQSEISCTMPLRRSDWRSRISSSSPCLSGDRPPFRNSQVAVCMGESGPRRSCASRSSKALEGSVRCRSTIGGPPALRPGGAVPASCCIPQHAQGTVHRRGHALSAPPGLKDCLHEVRHPTAAGPGPRSRAVH